MGVRGRTGKTYWDQVCYMLAARSLQGPDGLYVRTAMAAKVITSAKHGTIVIPSGPGKLEVVGFQGAPIKDEKEFEDKRGIIGKAFHKKQFVLVENVKDKEWEKDYHPFDALVNSELAVPIFDSSHIEIEAVINVEDEELDYFDEDQVWWLYGLGQVMLERRKELAEKGQLEKERIEEKKSLQKEKEQIKGILDAIPDEIMVIDRNFQPVYANIEKQRNHRILGRYLKNSRITLESLFEPGRKSTPDKENCCYMLIEQNEENCKKCICKRVMDLGKSIQGVIYEPRKLDYIVELSAAPLFSEGSTVGCVETARYITKRQRALDMVPGLLENAFKEEQLLEAIVKVVKNDLMYERARLYSIDRDKKTMTGVVFEGEHPKLTKEVFKKSKVIPPALREAFLETKTTGRIIVGDRDEGVDEARSYWEKRVSVGTMKKVIKAIDPQNLLNIAEISEFAIVPLSSREQRLLLVVEPEKKSGRFTSDDLQALTIFAHLVSVGLAIVKANQLRYKLAVVGETAFGLQHIFVRFIEKPESFVSNIFDPLREVADLGVRYLRSPATAKNNGALCGFLASMEKVIEKEVDIPNKGDVMELAEELKSELSDAGLSILEAELLEEVVRLRPSSEKEILHWKKVVVDAADNPVLLELLAGIVRLLVGLKNQARIPWEISLFADAFRQIAYSEMDRVEIPNRSNIIRVVRLVVGMMRGINVGKKVDIIEEYSDDTAFVRIRTGAYFLVFQALIENAIQAASTAGEKGKVIVKTRRFLDKEDQKEKVEISISNNGECIEEEDWNKIFIEPISNKSKPESHGLGLLFIHDWVTSSEGSSIEPHYDKRSGMTTFSIKVPLAV